MPLSPHARKLVVRILIELGDKMDGHPVCYEAGLEICQRVFGCVPMELPDYRFELEKCQHVKSRVRTIANSSVKAAIDAARTK